MRWCFLDGGGGMMTMNGRLNGVGLSTTFEGTKQMRANGYHEEVVQVTSSSGYHHHHHHDYHDYHYQNHHREHHHDHGHDHHRDDDHDMIMHDDNDVDVIGARKRNYSDAFPKPQLSAFAVSAVPRHQSRNLCHHQLRPTHEEHSSQRSRKTERLQNTLQRRQTEPEQEQEQERDPKFGSPIRSNYSTGYANIYETTTTNNTASKPKISGVDTAVDKLKKSKLEIMLENLFEARYPNRPSIAEILSSVANFNANIANSHHTSSEGRSTLSSSKPIIARYLSMAKSGVVFNDNDNVTITSNNENITATATSTQLPSSSLSSSTAMDTTISLSHIATTNGATIHNNVNDNNINNNYLPSTYKKLNGQKRKWIG